MFCSAFPFLAAAFLSFGNERQEGDGMSILFELERMERLITDLEELRRPKRVSVTEFYRREGKEEGSAFGSLEGWEKCDIREPWAVLESHRWYRTVVRIPEEFDRCHVEFLITTVG